MFHKMSYYFCRVYPLLYAEKTYIRCKVLLSVKQTIRYRRAIIAMLVAFLMINNSIESIAL